MGTRHLYAPKPQPGAVYKEELNVGETPPPPARTPVETYEYNPGLRRACTHNYKWDLEDETRRSSGEVPTMANLKISPPVMLSSESRRKSQETAYEQMQAQMFKRRVSVKSRETSRERSKSPKRPPLKESSSDLRPGIDMVAPASYSEVAIEDESNDSGRRTSFNFDDYKTNMFRKSHGGR